MVINRLFGKGKGSRRANASQSREDMAEHQESDEPENFAAPTLIPQDRSPITDADDSSGQTVELNIRPTDPLPFQILEEILLIHSDVHI